MTYYHHVENIEHAGLTFGVFTSHDGDHGAPWDECDGHGPVREVRGYGWNGRPEKNPGERVLYYDKGFAYLYDFAEAVRIAKRDGWGLAPEHKAKLAAKLGREPKPGEVREAAVERDFDYLRRYINDDWHYCVIRVVLLDIEGDETDEDDYLGGVEDGETSYILECAADMADNIARRVGDVTELVTETRAKRTTYTIREGETA